MSFQPTFLEDSLDPGSPSSRIPAARKAVIRFLMALCDAEGRWDDARSVPGTKLPAFATMAVKPASLVVWVIAERCSQLAIR